jgi:hypothetical protein
MKKRRLSYLNFDGLGNLLRSYAQEEIHANRNHGQNFHPPNA